MKTHLSHKPAGFLLVILLCLLLPKMQAQPFTVVVGATPACYTNTVSCSVTATAVPVNAVSFSWTASSLSGTCTPSILPSSPSGSTALISFNCCGIFSFTCTAVDNFGSPIQTATFTKTLGCTPNLSISAPSTVCAGSQVTLVASGAPSYTWHTGLPGNVLVVSPFTTTTYTVNGTGSSGCVGQATTTVSVISQPVPNFTYTQTSGQVFFNNLTTNTTVGTTYLWNFDNGQASTQVFPNTTYTLNSAYSVSLTANSGCGPATYVGSITVSSVPVATCAAGFSYNITSSGLGTFTSTSSGTLSNTTYSWSYGNGNTYSATGAAGVFASTTFGNGTYTVSLLMINSQPACSSTSTVAITVFVCSLQPNFTAASASSNTFTFTSTSIGTTTNTSYSWSFGDGATGSGSITMHSYSVSGNYSVTLTASNGGTCTFNTTSIVSPSVCNFISNFTHTVGTFGQVQFQNTSTNTQPNTNYYWDFGDGTFSPVENPSHTYQSGGTYYVSLKLTDTPNFCKDTLTQAVNVTSAPCGANSNFTIFPDLMPQYWYAMPLYPWNVVSATWDWGDGNQSHTLYTSHQYSAAASYSICLSVTVSCGNSSTYCYSQYINRSTESAADILYINVIRPAISNGLAEDAAETLSYQLYPNPNTGEFTLRFNREAAGLSVQIYDLLGKEVYSEKVPEEHHDNTRNIQLGDVNSGIYFIHIVSGNKSYTGKIVISR